MCGASDKVGFNHCLLVVSSTVICWTSLFVILGVSGLCHVVASDLGLHCLPLTLLRVSR